ncbi:glycoside hydrolase [Phaeosphaeria sp. MPI-PUGE-AT-0046c]|nr:glycoside hydrolase [Phaeosphaeria sp. MPI-PUGE-AT-0046c]
MHRFLVVSLAAALASAHSHVEDIWAPSPSVHYYGWNPNAYDTEPYRNDTPGWYTTGQGGRPLYPINANTYDIICNNNSLPANVSAPIAAGDSVRVRWWEPGPWPSNHKGPVIDYIAPCNGSCTDVDATKLKFVKIAQLGWIDDSWEEGYWASDKLLSDDNRWNITVPKGLEAGEYVLRTEIIALHQAHLAEGDGTYSPIGAELYPQCINLKVTGNGTKALTGGIDARTFYTGAEPGLAYKTLHETREHADYVIPGPRLWSGA